MYYYMCVYVCILAFILQINVKNCVHGVMNVKCYKQRSVETDGATEGCILPVVLTTFESSKSLCFDEQYELIHKYDLKCHSKLQKRRILLVHLAEHDSIKESLSSGDTSFHIAGFFVYTAKQKRMEVIDYSVRHNINVLVVDEQDFLVRWTQISRFVHSPSNVVTVELCSADIDQRNNFQSHQVSEIYMLNTLFAPEIYNITCV